jgi:GNAT superfamily N-acetyltransferase
MVVRLVEPDSDERWAAARQIVEEYAASLQLDLGFQGFDDEVRNLPREYGPPRGALLLAERDAAGGGQAPVLRGTEVVGCVALRPFGDGVCEMKRLYVRPSGRGGGVGRALAEAIIARGRQLGYRRMRLDTLPSMTEARALYAALGFVEIPAYRHNPVPGTTYMELRL